MLESINEQAFHIGKIALAMLLGGLIGFERELARKPAGFRTQMLVAGASAFLVILGDYVLIHFNGLAGDNNIQADPFRIVEAIITGISFIAAGTILRYSRKYQIIGLTTAATILMSGVIGMAVALDRFVLAVASALLSIAVTTGLSVLEQTVTRKKSYPPE
jgi:putative Mg2+ transporter-C (MgtC) family protein